MIVLLQAAYAIAIGALILGAATVATRILRVRGRSERMVWAGALGLSVALPFLLPLIGAPGLSAPEGAPAGIGRIVVLDFTPAAITLAPQSAFPGLGVILLTLWAAVSVVLGARLVSSLRTVARIRDRARPLDDGSDRIFVTERHGPAVVGFVRPIILVPEWILGLGETRRRWVLRHELEHIRGGDPWLLALILSTRILVPWNPIVWRLGSRLRAAIETDCDRRTLGEERESVLDYGEALIAVAGGPAPRVDPLPGIASAFAEPRLPLEDRIRSITTPPRKVSGFVKTVLAGMVALVAVVACEIPTPMNAEREVTEVVVPPANAAFDDRPVEELPPPPSDGPTFTPFEVAPVVQNRQEVTRALQREYPPLLRESGVEGGAEVWLYIDEEGRVQQSRINTTSGYDPLDQAALRVADSMQFSPALNRDKKVAVWVSLPIRFTVN